MGATPSLLAAAFDDGCGGWFMVDGICAAGLSAGSFALSHPVISPMKTATDITANFVFMVFLSLDTDDGVRGQVRRGNPKTRYGSAYMTGTSHF